jgi:hypothetical protein
VTPAFVCGRGTQIALSDTHIPVAPGHPTPGKFS